jgi:hypothetical protein
MELKQIITSGAELFVKGDTLYFLQWNEDIKNKFYSFGNELLEIKEEDYLLAIHPNWDKIQKKLNVPLHDYSWSKGDDNTIYLICFQSNKLHIFNSDGTLLRNINIDEKIPSGHCVYSIQVQEPNYIWLAYPTGQTVTKFDLINEVETWRIGDYTFDEVTEPLCYPESIFLKGNLLYISNMGTSSVKKLNIQNLELNDHLSTFPSRVWEYVEGDEKTFVRLEDGIYQITSKS